MENVIFHVHLEYCITILYNLWYFGIGSLWSFDIFPILVCLNQEKSGNPDLWRCFHRPGHPD
jgi:hypothetical protein